jgi:hypothetical protein
MVHYYKSLEIMHCEIELGEISYYPGAYKIKSGKGIGW